MSRCERSVRADLISQQLFRRKKRELINRMEEGGCNLLPINRILGAGCDVCSVDALRLTHVLKLLACLQFILLCGAEGQDPCDLLGRPYGQTHFGVLFFSRLRRRFVPV